jgi:hypothetical protein
MGSLLIIAAPQQKMERRSDRLRECCERAAERAVLENEEHNAPRGRQNRGNRGNGNRRHGQNNEENIPQEEEVDQNIGNNEVEGEEPPPPPPTLAEVMDR